MRKYIKYYTEIVLVILISNKMIFLSYLFLLKITNLSTCESSFKIFEKL